MAHVSLEQVRATYKERDAWWTVLLVDPLAGRLVRVTARIPWITPTRLTGASFLLGLAAAGGFLQATPGWLLAGAALYYLSFLVDCMDGKIARLHQSGTLVGFWLDFLLDRVRVVLCALAMFAGLFQQTGDPRFLYAATGATFLALFGYLNGAETDRARARMAAPDPGADAGAGRPAPADRLPPLLGRFRAALHRRRIRLNLVSGIEFEMALLVLAPVAAAVWGPFAALPVALVAGLLLAGFELLLMARFWLTARGYDRRSSRSPAPVPAPVPRAELPAASGRLHYPA